LNQVMNNLGLPFAAPRVYVSGHSGIKFSNCEIRNFGKGVFVRGLGHNYFSFEIVGCTFAQIVNPIYFLNTTTSNIKITDCKFFDCYDSIVAYIMPRNTICNFRTKISCNLCIFINCLNFDFFYWIIMGLFGSISSESNTVVVIDTNTIDVAGER
jgi:hypothetical protein